MRKLATIERITNLRPHPNADALELADIRGWQVVIKKGEFREGDCCIYCEIDSVLPEKPEFEFLRERKFRIKTIRLRGELSQGIAFPVSELHKYDSYRSLDLWIASIGQDVTNELGITLYQPPIPACLGGDVEGSFPALIPKTDCERIQNHSWILSEPSDIDWWVATEKLDGSSCTIYWDDELGLQVCSRNWNMRKSESNAYWRAAINMDLENKFRDSRLAWQGELVGPKVQGNRYDCRDYIIYFFDAYEIDRRHYLDFMDYRTAAANLKLPCVPLIHHELPLPNAAFADNEMPMKAILSLAEGKSVLNEKTEREGLVWKPIIESRDSRIGRVQFKAISNRFLLKNKE